MRKLGFEFVIVAAMAAGALRAERLPLIVLVDPGFDHFYNLEYDQALKIFDAEVAARPSADAYNHVAQTLVFRAMFRAGTLNSGVIASTHAFLHMPKVPMDDESRARFLDSIDRAERISLAAIERDPKQAGVWYSLGVSRGLKGDYDLFVCKSYLNALREMNAARAAHIHATEIDPGFVDARLIQGLYDYIVGSLPFGWRMLGSIGGYHGDRERGIETLNLVAQHGHWNRLDAKVMLAAIYRREKRPRQAVAVLQDLIPRMPRNYLVRLELAEMYADADDAPGADRVLNEIERLKACHAPGYDRLSDQRIAMTRERIAAVIADAGNKMAVDHGEPPAVRGKYR